jgi:DNA-binding GntR family transcriptional regulator
MPSSSGPLHRVNRHSDRALHRQISDHLGERVASASPGERLPSEAELAVQYDVNRLTIRRALTDLVRRGLVETVQGKGTFVGDPPLRYEVAAGRDASFTNGMRATGHDVSTALLKVRQDDDPEVAQRLGTRGSVRRFDLLRRVDGQPWSLTATWLHPRFRRIDEHWTGETSLYDVLHSRYGVRMLREDRSFTAVPADGADSEHLLVPLAAPVLVVRGRNVDEQGRAAALVQHRFRGDRVQFSVQLS